MATKTKAKKTRKAKAAPDAYAKERSPSATDADYELGCQVRALRDQGEAWWAIAAQLQLPGAGTSAKTGKRGAGQARRVYAKAFGSHPRTIRERSSKRGAPKERDENAAKLHEQRKEDRIARVRSGEGVVDLTLTDAELEDMFRGRKIGWTTMGLYKLEPVEREAWIHPDVGVKVSGEGEERVLDFREYHSTAPVDERAFPGQHRTIPLVQIHTVGKQQLASSAPRERKSKKQLKAERIAKAAAS